MHDTRLPSSKSRSLAPRPACEEQGRSVLALRAGKRYRDYWQMRSGQTSAGDLNELTFREDHLNVLPLRDGHLAYLDPHLLPLFREEIRSMSELRHLALDKELEALDEHLIWRWLNHAQKRRLVAPVAGLDGAGGERCWQLTEKGERRIGMRALLTRMNTARTLIMAVVGPVLAAFGGVAGFLATLRSQPLVAFALLGLSVGMLNRVVLLLIRHAWMRGRVVLASAIDKESRLQAFLRQNGAASAVRPAPLPSPSPGAAAEALLSSPRTRTAAMFVWGLGFGFSLTGFTIFGGLLAEHPYLLFTAYWFVFFAVHDVVLTAPGLRRTYRAWWERRKSSKRPERGVRPEATVEATATEPTTGAWDRAD